MTKRTKNANPKANDPTRAGGILDKDFFASDFDPDDSPDSDAAQNLDGLKSSYDRDTPSVVVATFDQLALSAADVEALADRPVWFLRDELADQVGLLERYPEPVLAPSTEQRLLGVLRDFTTAHAGDLQMLLGPTGSIRYGFHASVSIHEVIESFEDDGFDVLLGIRQGGVTLPSGPPDSSNSF